MADAAIPGPPPQPTGAAVLLRRLFGSPLNGILTLLVLWAVGSAAVPFVKWAVLDAVLLPAEPAACRDAQGACWSFVVAKGGQILFGIYPIEERWRPLLVSAVLLALLVHSLRPAAWRPRLAAVWALGLPAVFLLMFGGFGELSYVATTMWGGLPHMVVAT